jgi:glycolate oxidase FAD binding subunit
MMADVSQLMDELTAIIGSPFVQAAPLPDAYGVDAQVPWAVVSPANADEVAAVLALAHREELAVVPWGGGTGMRLGRPLERLDIALRLHRLNKLIAHAPADLTATAEAGILCGDLQEQLGSRRQWWPLDPPVPDRATLGGVLATNASGPRRLLHGTARDLLIGIKVAHADGVISKAGGQVTKNVTGYDMMKLYIGSLGTLGVIVEATLKLRPLPPVQALVRATFAGAEAAGEAARHVLASRLVPSAVELVNPPLSAWLWQRLEGLPGMEATEGWSLLVGIEGTEQAVARQVRDLQDICQQAGGSAYRSGHDDGGLWRTLLSRFSPEAATRPEPIVIRVGTVRAQLMATLAKLLQLESQLAEPLELTVRYGNGIIYGRLPLSDDGAQAAALGAALAGLRADLAAMRGYLVVDSAPPPFKAHIDCWGDLGPQVEVMGGLKTAFDPRRVLNPGRFVNSL